MIYRLAKIGGTVLLEVFFRSIVRTGASLCEHGPLLVVANHPNFLFDPALLGHVYNRPLWFLAKSTLFTSPLIARIMQSLHMVPVYRQQDNPAEMGKNRETFARAASSLLSGKAIAIFPEGVSLGLRRLSPMKTGAARIALQAEADADFTAGLRIQPVGITYAAMREFQSTVTVCVGEPIEVRPYREQYQADPQAATRMLTDAIEAALRAVTVEVQQDDNRELVDLLGKLYAANGYGGDDRALLSGIAEHVAVLAAEHPSVRQEIVLKLRWYVSLAGALHLDPARPLARQSLSFLAFAAPFIFWGTAFHLLPYRLVGALVSRNDATVETATIKLMLGTGVFIVWYAAFTVVCVWSGFGTLGVCAAVIVSLACGYFALRCLHLLRAAIAGFLMPGTAQARKELEGLSKELYGTCEELRKEYYTRER